MKHRAEWTKAVVGRIAQSAARQTQGASIERKEKYGNRKTNGYSSAKESQRASELEILERAGIITGLRKQVRFELFPVQRNEHGKLLERSWVYQSDFCYEQDGKLVCEDVKGLRTAKYVCARKAMLFLHGIRILET